MRRRWKNLQIFRGQLSPVTNPEIDPEIDPEISPAINSVISRRARYPQLQLAHLSLH